MKPTTQTRIDHIIDTIGLTICPSRKVLQLAIERAIVEQDILTRNACANAIRDLNHMTAGKNQYDPGIQGVNLALDAARDACEKVQAV